MKISSVEYLLSPFHMFFIILVVLGFRNLFYLDNYFKLCNRVNQFCKKSTRNKKFNFSPTNSYCISVSEIVNYYLLTYIFFRRNISNLNFEILISISPMLRKISEKRYFLFSSKTNTCII